ncbi:MAG: cupin domain-containing protein [Chloroflexota bacterium]|nr:cupin domain-containing protein [Chloroflexota bacterium]
MIPSSPARLAVVLPHGPDDPMVPGLTATTRLTAADTGSISIIEHLFAPGVLVPPHRHTYEDEISYVVEGEMGFRSDGREMSLGAGGYIVKPRGELHSMWNAGNRPARMIEIISPGGFENYFAELAAAVAAAGRLPDLEVETAIADRYGLVFEMTEVPDLIARHGLGPR